jgi:hypothetical protein
MNVKFFKYLSKVFATQQKNVEMDKLSDEIQENVENDAPILLV